MEVNPSECSIGRNDKYCSSPEIKTKIIEISKKMELQKGNGNIQSGDTFSQEVTPPQKADASRENNVALGNNLSANGSDQDLTSYEQSLKLLKHNTGCENVEAYKVESCVLSNNNIKSMIGADLVKHNFDINFNPKGPASSTEWLSNSHIDNVLDQAAKYYEGFAHINFQMSDFAENDDPDSLQNIDLAKLYNKYKSFGVVINTDVSGGSGEHWFCIYGTFDKKGITLEYFNSSGEPPILSVDIWLKETAEKLKKTLNVPVKIIRHMVPHQTDNHSCGPYSLYYILSRLSGVPSDVFDKKIIPSKLMVKFRKQILRD